MRGFQRYVTVRPLPYFRAPLQKCVKITFICKKSIAYVKKITVSVSVSLLLPLSRSYKIEFYFSIAVATKPGAPPNRMRRKLARQPTESVGPFAYMARTATVFTERQYGHGFYWNGYGERKRKAGNQMSVTGPMVSNSLSDSLRDLAVKSEYFRRDLKTHLFAGH